MLKKSIILSIISLVTTVISASNQVVIASTFGSSKELDTYLRITSFPLFLLAAISATLNYSLTPIIVRIKNKQSNISISALNVTITGLGICTLLITLLYAFTYNVESVNLYSNSKNMWNIIFTCLFVFNSLIVTYLITLSNAYEIFYSPMVANILPYIGLLILTITLGQKWGSLSISVGLFSGSIFSVLILFFRNKEVTSNFKKPLFGNDLFHYIKNVPFIFIGMFCFTGFQVIDALWATQLGDSNLSYLNYCQKIIVAFGTLVIAGPSSLLTPYLSNFLDESLKKTFNAVIGKIIRLTLIIAGVGSIFISVLAKNIISFLFERGNFTTIDTKNIAEIIPYYTFGMIPMVCVVIIFRAFMTKLLFRNAAFIGLSCMILYFTLSWILSKYFGVKGIAMAYLINWIIIFLVSIFLLVKKDIIKVLPIKFILKLTLLFCTLYAIFLPFSNYIQVHINDFFTLIFCLIIYSCMVLGFINILSMEDLTQLKIYNQVKVSIKNTFVKKEVEHL